MEEKPLLEIQLLGGFRLFIQGQETGQGLSVRLEALLAYLLLNRESPIPRQRLAFLFWPDTSEKQARTNLRNLLHKLRAVLPDANRFLSINQHTLQWKLDPHFILDVDKFSYLASRSNSIQDLEAATQLYPGDLMPDCYDDWVLTPRESLRQIYLTVLENLITILEEHTRLREALHYAQTLLRYDPIREQTYQHLMRLYAKCGDRASVARIYKTCLTVLERELGVKPGPESDKAYQKFIVKDTNWVSYRESAKIFPEEQITHNLPSSLTAFIGRGQELEQVEALLSNNRLVTLTGPGGIGKTRLALAAAREVLPVYRDGAFLVDLAPITDTGAVIAAIADALQTSDEVRALGMDGVKDHLRDQNLLLLLDNCEHLVEEVGAICVGLLPACPNVTILATSREALKVYGETLWQVPSLPTLILTESPDPDGLAAQIQALQANESVELFIERAISSLPTFKASNETLFSIGEICRRLEGMPLAIEMAAAQVKTLSVQQIVQRLDRATDVLQHPSSSARHRTMEAVMDWSYSLLIHAERKLFARLGVFSGTFSLQALEEICQGHGIRKDDILGLLASLVDKSLVSTQPTYPEVRFRLHEIVRQYAYQKLNDSYQVRHWMDRHLDYFVSLAEKAEPKIRGSQQIEWLNRLELELGNLRGALQYAQDKDLDSEDRGYYIESLARLAGALWVFWFIRGRFSEGRRWAEQALAFLRQTGGASPLLGKVLYTAGSFCFFQGDFALAEELSLESLRVCKSSNDLFGEAISYHLSLPGNNTSNACHGRLSRMRLQEEWSVPVTLHSIQCS
jgi:predicted ATPase/DNA-binding SARP family transcriptional activator